MRNPIEGLVALSAAEIVDSKVAAVDSAAVARVGLEVAVDTALAHPD